MRLLGFKSFVDPVELSILPGLTGIVGPNGCGKSNLLEALRWVMGENRPTSVRGGGMEDVIFAGAGTRPPKNFAEVVLGLEEVNIQSGTPDKQNNVVDVVRRVTRDIGSSFRLNGKDVRAKDIAMLFADSSTGAYSPSLVRQGQITELINANPKSRRRLLEEAAGISGLYQRRHEAELKLKSSEGNLGRLQDIYEQLQSQLKILEKQALQAIKYRELGDEIREKEGFLLCKKWVEANQKNILEEKSLINFTKMSSSAETELKLARSERDKAEVTISDFRDDETRAVTALQRLTVEDEAIKKEQERAEASILELKNRSEEVIKDCGRQELFIGDAGAVIDRLAWELNQLKNLEENQEDSILKSKTDASAFATKLNNDESELDRLAEQFTQLSVKYQSIDTQLNETNQARDETTKELDNLQETKDSVKKIQYQKGADLKKAQDILLLCEEKSRAAEEALKSTELVRAENAIKESQARIEFSTETGRLAALEAERDALEELLSLSNQESKDVISEVKIEKGFEDALGAVFGDEFNASIVADNISSGWYELPELENIAELPLGATPMGEKVLAPPVLKRKISMVGLIKSSEGPRLQEQLKVGQTLVSTEGDIWRWDGFCTVGQDKLSPGALRLRQENRLKDLRVEIRVIKEKIVLLDQELLIATENLSKAEKEDSEARNLRKNCDDNLFDAFRSLSTIESEVSKASSKFQSLEESVKYREADRKKLESDINELKKSFVELEGFENVKGELEEQRTNVEKSRSMMVEKRALYDQAQRDARTRTKRIVELKDETENWENRLAIAKESIFELETRKTVLNLELEKATELPNILSQNKKKLGEMLLEAEKQKIKASEALSIQESELRRLVIKERASETGASELREEVVRARVKKENAEYNQAELEKLVLEKVGKNVKEFIETLADDFSNIPSVQEIENLLVKLKNRRESLGSVNLRAEEDTKELSEELNSLLVEKTDLESAITKLRSGIAKLNTEGRSRLLTAYKNVNRNFSELFETLFGGGVAKLELVEHDDPLDAGLEIMCQPPGKKLSTLSLLSGGEQTLTAMALIFAVFKANPSPICVLDEVDAPLDDANVERFCCLLDEMKDRTNTRFMVITHHPLTMSRMDRLYGVTMVERGVSQLVSVDLKKAEELLDF